MRPPALFWSLHLLYFDDLLYFDHSIWFSQQAYEEEAYLLHSQTRLSSGAEPHLPIAVQPTGPPDQNLPRAGARGRLWKVKWTWLVWQSSVQGVAAMEIESRFHDQPVQHMGKVLWSDALSKCQNTVIEKQLKTNKTAKCLLLKKFYLLIFRERGRDREKYWFVVLPMYAFIGCFLYVPWLEIEPSTLAYQDDTPTHCATRPGTKCLVHCSFLTSNLPWGPNACSFQWAFIKHLRIVSWALFKGSREDKEHEI